MYKTDLVSFFLLHRTFDVDFTCTYIYGYICYNLYLNLVIFKHIISFMYFYIFVHYVNCICLLQKYKMGVHISRFLVLVSSLWFFFRNFETIKKGFEKSLKKKSTKDWSCLIAITTFNIFTIKH